MDSKTKPTDERRIRFTSEELDRFLDRFDASTVQQYRPMETRVLEDPITGHRSILAPGRQHRHVEQIRRVDGKFADAHSSTGGTSK